MHPATRAQLTSHFGPITRVTAVTGGDINDAFRVSLDSGRDIFVKAHRAAPRAMFEREAAGLGWLAEAGTLRTPEVLAVGDSFLALELIEAGSRANDFAQQLGRGLALLHRRGAPGFGWQEDNFIGTLPQVNTARPSWPEFYATCRLEPQLRRAVDSGRASASMVRDMQTLLIRIDGLVGPPEPPSRLHGDLWGGNCHVDERGRPVLIDPAVYGGHREVDLAMMRLFGGFAEPVFEAYEETWPLAAGAAERLPLYQLYPLLVHVNLFGGSYVGAVERAVARLL